MKINPRIGGITVSWNFRVLYDEQGEDIHYWVGEVYYDANGSPHSYSLETGVVGDTLEEIEWELGRMREALDKPILEAW